MTTTSAFGMLAAVLRPVGSPRVSRAASAADIDVAVPSPPQPPSPVPAEGGDRATATPRHDVVTGRAVDVGLLPKALRDDAALLSPAGQLALTKLCLKHAAHVDAIVESLADFSLWSVPMRPNDEARVLAKAIECVPLSTTTAKQPSPPIHAVAAIDARTDGRTAVANAFALVEKAWAGGADVVLAPEWLFVPAHGPAMSAADKDVLLDRLAALTRGSDRLLVPGTIPWHDDDDVHGGGYHNTAFAFSDGKVVHSVDKRGDGDDVDIAKSIGRAHVADVGGSTFEWRGVTVGLEVCRDHGDARLRHELLAGKRDVVDLQLVVSSGVWLKHAAVGIGGTVLVAQGDGIAGHERGVRGDDGRLVVDTLS